MTMWQVAAGQASLDFSHVFRDHDVMLVGWSQEADFTRNPEAYPATNEGVGSVRRMATQPEPGDVVVIRVGQEAAGIGVVPDERFDLVPEDQAYGPEYAFLEQFIDVCGWDVRHARRVAWADEESAIHQRVCALKQPFAAQGGQHTFTRMEKRTGLFPSEEEVRADVKPRALRPLPVGGQELSDQDLGERLFREGLSNEHIEKLIQALRQAQRLAAWYETLEQNDGDSQRPTEHELVAHQILPIMRALGWSDQLLAVEYRASWAETKGGIDLAFLGSPSGGKKDLVMICEAKRRAESLADAYHQAQGYAEGTPCQLIITTDGRRMIVYRRQGEKWPHSTIYGYVNMRHLRSGPHFHDRRMHEGDGPMAPCPTLAKLTPHGVFRHLGGGGEQ